LKKHIHIDSRVSVDFIKLIVYRIVDRPCTCDSWSKAVHQFLTMSNNWKRQKFIAAMKQMRRNYERLRKSNNEQHASHPGLLSAVASIEVSQVVYEISASISESRCGMCENLVHNRFMMSHDRGAEVVMRRNNHVDLFGGQTLHQAHCLRVLLEQSLPIS
jgi:hypothetical protein